MLELRRLRLLSELHRRGTIAAVADALRFTPSAVSQQLSMLEREAGVPLLQKAGRGVRLTDAALVLVEHADALLARTAEAEADLAAAAGAVAGRARVAGFQSVLLRLAIPAIERVEAAAPKLRVEIVEAEPETTLPALALGDLDVVLADEWEPRTLQLPPGLAREELLADPVSVVLPTDHPAARRDAPVELRGLAGERWISGPAGMGWDDVTLRTCHGLGGFEPDIRHRVDDTSVSLPLVARGHGVALLPGLALLDHPGDVAVRPLAEGTLRRRIFVATRAVDAQRPSIQALLDALRAQADGLR